MYDSNSYNISQEKVGFDKAIKSELKNIFIKLFGYSWDENHLGKDDIIFLLKNAKEKGDEKRFQKLWQSAHKRKAVNLTKMEEIFSQIENSGLNL